MMRKAIESDIHALKDRLRESDKQELLAAGNESVEAALTKALTHSIEAYAIEMNGVVMALFGISPDTLCGSSACIWFLGGEGMNDIKKAFVKKSREVISYWLTKYDILWNLVDGRYLTSIKWLKSCGAKFQEEPIISNGVPFYLFRVERK